MGKPVADATHADCEVLFDDGEGPSLSSPSSDGDSWDDWDDEVQSDDATLKILSVGLRALQAALSRPVFVAHINLAQSNGVEVLDFASALLAMSEADARKLQWVMDKF